MNLFNSIRVRPPKLNRFNLSHDVKLTGKFGKLIPIMCQDVLPGDVFRCNSEVLLRMAPMIAPIMTKVNVYTHFFFVPKRLLWDDWKDFITGGESGEQTSAIYPRIKVPYTFDRDTSKWSPLFHSGSLADYLGYPVTMGNEYMYPNTSIEIDALPFRAYQLIYNEYYRDQNVMDEVDIRTDLGGIIDTDMDPDLAGLMMLRNRCWRKDYFTSALPWAQRGDEVELPLQGDLDVVPKESGSIVTLQGSGLNLVRGLNASTISNGNVINDSGHLRIAGSNPVSLGNTIFSDDTSHIEVSGLAKSVADKLSVDLSSASSATINELRRAIKAQEFLELAARGGSRYIEQIYAYFGVKSSDARLQRPEFLGGGKSPVMVSDVLQTSQSTDNSAQANPSGHGVSVQRSHSFKFRSEEHGYIIGIMSVMPDAAYMQGMPRMYSKFDRLDYYWPQFAHLGEQEIKNKELYFNCALAPQNQPNGDGTFGYTPRYAEYKFANDSIHGDFRDSLSFWHMARIFGNQPSLNEDFLTNVQDASDRVFNVVNEDVDKLWCNIHHNLIALRKMPKYGTPLF